MESGRVSYRSDISLSPLISCQNIGLAAIIITRSSAAFSLDLVLKEPYVLAVRVSRAALKGGGTVIDPKQTRGRFGGTAEEAIKNPED